VRGGPQRRRAALVACARGAALAGEQDGAVVVLTRGDDPSATATDLAQRLAEPGDPVTVGAAGPVLPVHGLAAAHAEARRTADALDALGLVGRGAAAADLGFAGLVLGDRADLDRYLERVLGPLSAYDDRRGSDLIGTLTAWFAAGGSPRRAADALHVHPNTVGQRLARIATLLGPLWQEPDQALELQLALRLHRLRAVR
jgi:DNA-binding PucR family transcriptional regulator